MGRHPDIDSATFWEHVREVLRDRVRQRKGGEKNGTLTQAQLARQLGLSPSRLANFLGSPDASIGGLAVARACAAGIEFMCNDQRIGRLGGEVPRQSNASDQLVLEFGEGFHVVQEANPLLIELKKGPTAAGPSAGQAIRLKIVS